MLNTPNRNADRVFSASGSVEGVSRLFRICHSSPVVLTPAPPTVADDDSTADHAPLLPKQAEVLPSPLPTRPAGDEEQPTATSPAENDSQGRSSSIKQAASTTSTMGKGTPKRPSMSSSSSSGSPTSDAPNEGEDGAIERNASIPQLDVGLLDATAPQPSNAANSGRAPSSESDRMRASQTPTSIAANRKRKTLPAAAHGASDGRNGARYRALRSLAKVLHTILTLVYVLAAVPAKFFGGVVARFTERVYEKRQLQRLRAIMDATEDHKTWDDTAKALDELQGYNEWSTRNVELTKVFCEPDMLADETVVIAKLAASAHDPSTASYIQTALHRDLYGCTQDPLYRYYRGTKVFVSEYISAVTQLIEEFAEVQPLAHASPRAAGSMLASPHVAQPDVLMQSLGTVPSSGAALSAGGDAMRSLLGDATLMGTPGMSASAPGVSPPPMQVHGAAPRGAVGAAGTHGLFPAGPPLASSEMSTAAPPLLNATAEPVLHRPMPLPTPRSIARADLATLARRSISDDCGPQLRRLVEIAERAAVDAERDGDASENSSDDDDGRPYRADRMSLDAKIETLETALQSFGSSALLLSGGAALGMYHSGTVRALWNEGLLPRIMCGSSAGAIIASIFCTRTDEDVNRLCNGKAGNILDGMTLHAFELEKDLRHATSLMDVKQLMKCLQENVGGETFLEAYQRTGRVLNVSIAAEGREGEKSMLLNYVTAPNIIIWSGVAASCAMPGLFSPVQLLKRKVNGGPADVEPHLPGQLWFDGSVPCDLPKQRLAELFNCNYFIVSQANPHVVPFLPKPPSHLVNKRRPAIVKRAWSAACGEMKHWMLKLYRFHLLPRHGAWELPYLMCNQSFTGDVTIRPIGSVFRALPDFINLTSNPTQRHMEYVVANAQRQTWPYLIQIQYSTEVERCLVRCIAELKQRRAAASPFQPVFVPTADRLHHAY